MNSHLCIILVFVCVSAPAVVYIYCMPLSAIVVANLDRYPFWQQHILVKPIRLYCVTRQNFTRFSFVIHFWICSLYLQRERCANTWTQHNARAHCDGFQSISFHIFQHNAMAHMTVAINPEPGTANFGGSFFTEIWM